MSDEDLHRAIGRLEGKVDAIQHSVDNHHAKEPRVWETIAKMDKRLAAIEQCAPGIKTAAEDWRNLKNKGLGLLIGVGMTAGTFGASARELWSWVARKVGVG